MRREIIRKKLDSLEADNWHEEKRKADDDDDDEYDPLADASSGDGASPAAEHCRACFCCAVTLPPPLVDAQDLAVIVWHAR